MKNQKNNIMHTKQQNQTTNIWVTTNTNLVDFSNPLNDYQYENQQENNFQIQKSKRHTNQTMQKWKIHTSKVPKKE